MPTFKWFCEFWLKYRNSSESADLKKVLVVTEVQFKNVLYHIIDIGVGIKVEDPGQPNILGPFKETTIN